MPAARTNKRIVDMKSDNCVRESVARWYATAGRRAGRAHAPARLRAVRSMIDLSPGQAAAAAELSAVDSSMMNPSRQVVRRSLLELPGVSNMACDTTLQWHMPCTNTNVAPLTQHRYSVDSRHYTPCCIIHHQSSPLSCHGSAVQNLNGHITGPGQGCTQPPISR